MSKLIRTDFHVHTNHSLCGHPDATPRAVVRAAQDAELEAVGITDHLVVPINFDRPRLVREELPGELDDLRVYVGGEAIVSDDISARAGVSDGHLTLGLGYQDESWAASYAFVDNWNAEAVRPLFGSSNTHMLSIIYSW